MSKLRTRETSSLCLTRAKLNIDICNLISLAITFGRFLMFIWYKLTRKAIVTKRSSNYMSNIRCCCCALAQTARSKGHMPRVCEDIYLLYIPYFCSTISHHTPPPSLQNFRMREFCMICFLTQCVRTRYPVHNCSNVHHTAYVRSPRSFMYCSAG